MMLNNAKWLLSLKELEVCKVLQQQKQQLKKKRGPAHAEEPTVVVRVSQQLAKSLAQ